jgi:hypothetical protein
MTIVKRPGQMEIELPDSFAGDAPAVLSDHDPQASALPIALMP